MNALLAKDQTATYEMIILQHYLLGVGPIIGADIKHFTDYRYRPFSKQIGR